MNEKVTIVLVGGSAREDAQSVRAARWIAEEGRTRGDAEIVLVNPRDFSLPLDGGPEHGRDPHYSELTAKADAFFIVTPEYNNSYSGSIKRLLDSEEENYFHKPIMLAGVSSGQWGGVRACLALQPVCHSLGLINIPKKLYFPKVQELFDDQDNLRPEYAGVYEKNVHAAYDELVWFARALKAAKA